MLMVKLLKMTADFVCGIYAFGRKDLVVNYLARTHPDTKGLSLKETALRLAICDYIIAKGGASMVDGRRVGVMIHGSSGNRSSVASVSFCSAYMQANK